MMVVSLSNSSWDHDHSTQSATLRRCGGRESAPVARSLQHCHFGSVGTPNAPPDFEGTGLR